MVRVTTQTGDVQWIYALARRISRHAIPVKPPSYRTRPAMELVEVATTLMERGERLLKERPRRGAIDFRDGLMVLAETCLPLRRKNYAGLCLGRTLFREDGRHRVSFPAGKMKNSRDWEGWYPEWLTDRLDFYIGRVRSLFRAGLNELDEGWLWLGYQGQPMKVECVSMRVRQIVEKATGVPLSLHSFRHSVTTDIAIHDPKHVGIVKSLLGHTSPLSARYYDLATNIEASMRYQKLISEVIQDDLESGG